MVISQYRPAKDIGVSTRHSNEIVHNKRGINPGTGYNALAGQGASLGLIKKDQSTAEGYVTQKALDGLYFMIGE